MTPDERVAPSEAALHALEHKLREEFRYAIQTLSNARRAEAWEILNQLVATIGADRDRLREALRHKSMNSRPGGDAVGIAVVIVGGIIAFFLIIACLNGDQL